MNEFELALGFLQAYVQAAVAAAERGEPIDDAREFRRYCSEFGVEITPERVELTRDLAGVIKECLASDDTEEGDEDTHLIAAGRLLEGLEIYGWRGEYLEKDVAA